MKLKEILKDSNYKLTVNLLDLAVEMVEIEIEIGE